MGGRHLPNWQQCLLLISLSLAEQNCPILLLHGKQHVISALLTQRFLLKTSYFLLSTLQFLHMTFCCDCLTAIRSGCPSKPQSIPREPRQTRHCHSRFASRTMEAESEKTPSPTMNAPALREEEAPPVIQAQRQCSDCVKRFLVWTTTAIESIQRCMSYVQNE